VVFVRHSRAVLENYISCVTITAFRITSSISFTGNPTSPFYIRWAVEKTPLNEQGI
jgi:hypothetical protein